MQVCKSYIKLELCWSFSTSGSQNFVQNLCQTGQGKSQVFPCLAVQIQQESELISPGPAEIWAGAGGSHFTEELVKGLTWTNQLQLPHQSLCFPSAYNNAFLLPKNPSKWTMDTFPLGWVKAVSPSSLWKGLFLELVFVKRWNLQNLFHFCSYQRKCFISSTQK